MNGSASIESAAPRPTSRLVARLGLVLIGLLAPALAPAFTPTREATSAPAEEAEAAPAGETATPAVARARYRAAGSEHAGGTVFFLELPAGVAAVGAAHSFDLVALGVAGEVHFELGHSQHAVGRASRFLAAPGLPFSAPGGTVRDDLALFVLDVPLSGVRTLRAGAPARKGERLLVLGIPAKAAGDEVALAGHVSAQDERELQVELDGTADLRGWGGAPIVSAEDGRVVGVLQGAAARGKRLRLSASPITAVLAAAARPLDGGRGRAFATEAARAPAARGKPRSGPPAPAAPARQGPLLGKQGVKSTRDLWLEIDHPSDGAVFGDEHGAFVAGRALAPLGEYRSLDAVLVLDVSDSTRAPSGADVNGDGVVGEHRGGGVGAFLGLGSSDAGDSILAAEVAAARRLVDRLDPRSTRVGIVTFAGELPPEGLVVIGDLPPPAVTEVALTGEYGEVRRGLDRILERGPFGMTHMAAGVDQATTELLGLRGAFSEPDPESDKVVLFLTDGQPTLPYGIEQEQANTRAVLRAAERARKAHVRVYTFGIGEDALAGPLAIVRLADLTDGSFTPVRDPAAIVQVIDQVDFANLEGVTVRNVTTGAPATQSSTNPDGSFSALVPLKTGKNVIEATARATDGRMVSQRIEVQHAPGAPDPPLTDVLLTARNRLLEERLVELQRARLDVEREQVEAARKALAIEMERDRAQALERAESQRKTLQIDVDDRGGAEPKPGEKPGPAPAPAPAP
ncbi:MAG: VWA domain-containing protein [Deltaproteobacteria bacterium]|nr:VWA domain-containing protein [Deltaproteobacteria bacterium]